jgi:hypothetical protein
MIYKAIVSMIPPPPPSIGHRQANAPLQRLILVTSRDSPDFFLFLKGIGKTKVKAWISYLYRHQSTMSPSTKIDL